jgi:hypothetical protein
MKILKIYSQSSFNNMHNYYFLNVNSFQKIYIWILLSTNMLMTIIWKTKIQTHDL